MEAMIAFLGQNPVIANSLAIVGAVGLAAIDAASDPAPSWLKVIVEAGMVGVLLVFLLRVLPGILEHSRRIHQDARDAIREHTESHRAAQRELVEAFERINAHWRAIIETHRYCPARDGGRDPEKS